MKGYELFSVQTQDKIDYLKDVDFSCYFVG